MFIPSAVGQCQCWASIFWIIIRIPHTLCWVPPSNINPVVNLATKTKHQQLGSVHKGHSFPSHLLTKGYPKLLMTLYKLAQNLSVYLSIWRKRSCWSYECIFHDTSTCLLGPRGRTNQAALTRQPLAPQFGRCKP